MPERSFVTAGHQWPVCARCAGIYLGLVVGFAGWLIIRRVVARRPFAGASLKVLAVVAVPTLLSWIGGVAGIWDGTNAIRFALAAPLGIVAGAIVAAVASKDLR